MDLLQWLKEDDQVEVRPAAHLADEAKKAVSRFRFTFSSEEAASLIRQVTDQYSALESRCKRLALRVFLDPQDRESRKSYRGLMEYRRQFLLEYSDFFALVTQSAKGEKASIHLGRAYWNALKRLAGSYRKELSLELDAEEEAVTAHLQRLDQLSFSNTRPAAPRGDVRRLLQSMSRDRRMRAYHSLAGELARSKTAAEKELVKLHELRRKIAEKAGYLSFYDFAVMRSGLTEEARSDIPFFRSLVAEHLAPLVRRIRTMQWERIGVSNPRPWDLLYPAAFGLPVLDPQAFPLENTYLQALTSMFSAKHPLFEAMKEEGALSFQVTGGPSPEEMSENLCGRDAQSGVMGVHIPDAGRSFLFLSQVPQERLGRILFAETGVLLLEQADAALAARPYALAETEAVLQTVKHSMAFLSQRTWGLFYGNMARYACEYDLLELAADLPLYCALDEMEEFLCRARVTNLNVFRHAWGEIAGRYQLDGAAEGFPGLLPLEDLWLYSPAWWKQPLTGIYYALAAVSVLGTLPLGRHYTRLEDSFARLLVSQADISSFERMSDAGYPSPFEEETVRKAAFAIADFLGL